MQAERVVTIQPGPLVLSEEEHVSICSTCSGNSWCRDSFTFFIRGRGGATAESPLRVGEHVWDVGRIETGHTGAPQWVHPCVQRYWLPLFR
eukprot:364935-Chlamydomonas_euryale.AAC.3